MEEKLKNFVYQLQLVNQEQFFDQLIKKIDIHFDGIVAHNIGDLANKREKGQFFEFICVALIKNGAFDRYFHKVKECWLFKDIPIDIKKFLCFSNKDMGIDIIVKNIDDEWFPIQCKYKKKSIHNKPIRNKVDWKTLSTFYSLCDRTGPPKGWHKLVVITNCESINRQGRKSYKDLSVCIGSFRAIPKDIWFKSIGNKIDNNEIRMKRLAYYNKL